MLLFLYTSQGLSVVCIGISIEVGITDIVSKGTYLVRLKTTTYKEKEFDTAAYHVQWSIQSPNDGKGYRDGSTNSQQ